MVSVLGWVSERVPASDSVPGSELVPAALAMAEVVVRPRLPVVCRKAHDAPGGLDARLHVGTGGRTVNALEHETNRPKQRDERDPARA